MLADDGNTIRDGLEFKLCHRPRNESKPAAADAAPDAEGYADAEENSDSHEELWKAYTQLTEAEAAFRIHKSVQNNINDQALEPAHITVLSLFVIFFIEPIEAAFQLTS